MFPDLYCCLPTLSQTASPEPSGEDSHTGCLTLNTSQTAGSLATQLNRQQTVLYLTTVLDVIIQTDGAWQ